MVTQISGGGIDSNTTLSDRWRHIFKEMVTQISGGGIDSNTTLSDRLKHRFQEEELTVIQHFPTDGDTDFRRRN